MQLGACTSAIPLLAVQRRKGAEQRDIADSMGTRAPTPGPTTALYAGLDEDSALHQTQSDVLTQTPGYYTKEGQRPRQYTAILLMTLQYGRALEFMHGHAMTGGMRDEAAALALALHDSGIYAAGEPPKRGGVTAAQARSPVTSCLFMMRGIVDVGDLHFQVFHPEYSL